MLYCFCLCTIVVLECCIIFTCVPLLCLYAVLFLIVYYCCVCMLYCFYLCTIVVLVCCILFACVLLLCLYAVLFLLVYYCWACMLYCFCLCTIVVFVCCIVFALLLILYHDCTFTGKLLHKLNYSVFTMCFKLISVRFKTEKEQYLLIIRISMSQGGHHILLYIMQ